MQQKWVEQIAMLCISGSPLQRRGWGESQEFDTETNNKLNTVNILEKKVVEIGHDSETLEMIENFLKKASNWRYEPT